MNKNDKLFMAIKDHSLIELHLILNHIVTKLPKQNIPPIVRINLVNYNLRIRHIQPPLLQERHRILKLLI